MLRFDYITGLFSLYFCLIIRKNLGLPAGNEGVGKLG